MKRFFSWKWVRRGLIGIAAIITLLAAIWTIENIRGQRAWSNYKAQMEAQGEVFDWQAFIPPTVPDEMNFALAPTFATLDWKGEKSRGQDALGRKIDIHLESPGKKAPRLSYPIDLEVYQEFFAGNTNYPQSTRPQSAAEDVLVAISGFDEELSLLHQAAEERPLSRFPIRYEDNFEVLLPHLNMMRGVVSTLVLRSVAYMETGRQEDAFRDARLVLRLSDSVKDEPMLISYLVRVGLCHQASLLVKEGIARHAWNQEQLAFFQTYFSELDLLSEHQRGLRSERAMFIELVYALGRGDYPISALFNPSENSVKSPGKNIFPFPHGWLNQNNRIMSEWHQKYTIGAVEPKARRVFPDIPTAGEEMLQATATAVPNPYDSLARMLLPAVIGLANRTAGGQTLVDQTTLACALERFYLAHQQYPDSLQDLVPRFINTLPHDVITGGPLNYRRTSNGFYRLYAVGWDAQDDGGKFVDTSSPKARSGNHDWVWQFSE